MNEELKTKTDDFRKRAPIPKLFIIHFSFFIIHCSSLFIIHSSFTKAKLHPPFPAM